MEPEIIDLGSSNVSTGGLKSTNFGPGIELLMNEKSKSSDNLNDDTIHLDDLNDLEKDLNNLTVNNDDAFKVNFDEPNISLNSLPQPKTVTIGEATRNTEINQSTWDGFSQSNDIPITPSADLSLKPALSKEDSLKEKFNLLRKLETLEKKGIELTKKYTMESNLMEMKGEYEMLVAEKERQNSVKFQGNMLSAFINGVEFLNNRFDPFDLKLDGWGEQFSENVNDYDEIFAELHEKYKSTAKMAPEIKLIFQLAASGMMVHMTNTMFKSAMPNMDDVLKQNPDLMNQFNAAAMESVGKTNPGFSGFMNNMMNGGPQNSGPSNSNLNMGPPPPPIQTQNINPPRRPGMMSSNRPDLQASKEDAIELNNNFVDINNEKSSRPLTSETRARPEMKGPSDISDLLNGLKSKSDSINNKIDPFKNDRKSPGIAAVETKNIKDVSIPTFEKPVTVEKDETGSTISLTELKEMESEGSVPRKQRKKQRSSRNTISIDI
tara:strand:+ start:1805 stop:3280 length:1476 start_codon:yes stop_codon:yes gene_type:complete